MSYLELHLYDKAASNAKDGLELDPNNDDLKSLLQQSIEGSNTK